MFFQEVSSILPSRCRKFCYGPDEEEEKKEGTRLAAPSGKKKQQRGALLGCWLREKGALW